MADLPFTPLGIVRTRDLVQATIGVRFTTFVKSTNFAEPTVVLQILKPDPRRISYEIYISETSGNGLMAVDFFDISVKGGPITNMLVVVVPAGGTVVIQRDWRKDGDGVCAPLWCLNDAAIDIGTAVSNVSVRETFLSPNPVDEPVV